MPAESRSRDGQSRRVELALMGGAVLRGEEGPLTGPVARRHPLALLALLALTPSGSLSRAKVIGMLWPDVAEATGRNRLTSCVYHLRQALGRGAVVSAGDDIRLNRDSIGCDVWRLETALAGDGNDGVTEAYGGPLLDGFFLDNSPEFDQWVEGERGRWRRAYLRALERLAGEADRHGDQSAAVRWCQELAREDPYDSRIAARLVEALATAGNRAEALRAADAHTRRLADELGAEPDDAFRAVLSRVRGAQSPSGAASNTSHARREVESRATSAGDRRTDDPAGIAVLPFEELSAERSVIADAIHAGILTRLADLRDLRVIARTSVRQYRDTAQPASAIARELRVEWVLEGDVRQTGDGVQVNVRLVEASTDRQVWARTFMRAPSARGLFELEAEVTRAIADSLDLRLSSGERTRVARSPTANIDAYRLHAQGRMHLEQRTPENMRRALDCFERVLALDDTYALAWVGLADALGLLHAYGHLDGDQVLPRAESAIRRALELDPALAEAHAALGRLLGQRNEAIAAGRELKRAVELKPGYAEAHNWLSVGHQVLGRPGAALESAVRAVELNPLSPEAVCNLATSYIINGEHDLALLEARRTREIAATYVSGALFEGIALYHLGRHDDAAEVLRDMELAWAPAAPLAVSALATAAAGKDADARALLERIEASDAPFDIGLVRLALGETDRAFDAFERVDFDSIDFSSSYWPTLAVRYLFTDVWARAAGDPRLPALRTRMDASWGVQPTRRTPADS